MCSKFTGEYPCQSLIRKATLLRFRHGCSPVKLQHIFRTPFPKNTSERQLVACFQSRKLSFKTFLIFLDLFVPKNMCSTTLCKLQTYVWSFLPRVAGIMIPRLICNRDLNFECQEPSIQYVREIFWKTNISQGTFNHYTTFFRPSSLLCSGS